jgi:hypothetical protein
LEPALPETRIAERCPSGLRSTPGKCVYVNSVSRVRIPLSPPYNEKALIIQGFFVSVVLGGQLAFDHRFENVIEELLF